jgi:hypothetical protein
MDTLLLVAILLGLGALAVLIISLIDRVNRIERQASLSGEGERKPPLFGDLSGKKLWDVVSGKATPGWDKMAVDQLRNRYQPVLRKQVEELFADGLKDGQQGVPFPVNNPRVVTTLRGSVESWIPQQAATAIYQAGFERARAQPDALPALRQRLDEAVNGLFGKASIKLPRPISQDLIPDFGTPAGAEADSGQPGQDRTAGQSDATGTAGPGSEGAGASGPAPAGGPVTAPATAGGGGGQPPG